MFSTFLYRNKTRQKKKNESERNQPLLSTIVQLKHTSIVSQVTDLIQNAVELCCLWLSTKGANSKKDFKMTGLGRLDTGPLV